MQRSSVSRARWYAAIAWVASPIWLSYVSASCRRISTRGARLRLALGVARERTDQVGPLFCLR
jgi:hypothetical protein